MIEKSMQVLSKDGWVKCGEDGMYACMSGNRVRMDEVSFRLFDGAFIENIGLFAGFCVSEETPILLRSGMSIPAGLLKSENSIEVNFSAAEPFKERNELAFLGALTKSTDRDCPNKRGGVCYTNEIPNHYRDVINYKRFEYLVQWHGREYVEDKAGRQKVGFIEFCNYNKEAREIIRLSAASDGRVSSDKCGIVTTSIANDNCLMVANKSKIINSHGFTVNAEGEYILCKYKGVISFVGTNI